MATDLVGADGAGMDVFSLAERRLTWIGERQRVLAQNIANADTPAYRSRDLAPFDALVQDRAVTPSRTSPLHLAGLTPGVRSAAAIPREKAPDGNAVSLETELTKIAQDETDTALVGNLWKSTMGLYLDALGRGG